jgi:hypothetical protein
MMHLTFKLTELFHSLSLQLTITMMDPMESAGPTLNSLTILNVDSAFPFHDAPNTVHDVPDTVHGMPNAVNSAFPFHDVPATVNSAFPFHDVPTTVNSTFPFHDVAGWGVTHLPFGGNGSMSSHNPDGMKPGLFFHITRSDIICADFKMVFI